MFWCVGKSEINYCKDAFVQKYHIDKVSEVVAGGKERYESVYQGLCACHKTDYVLIHDGARPFVTEELIQRGLDCAKEYQACAAGVPSKDTVKIIGEGKKGGIYTGSESCVECSDTTDI